MRRPRGVPSLESPFTQSRGTGAEHGPLSSLSVLCPLLFSQPTFILGTFLSKHFSEPHTVPVVQVTLIHHRVPRQPPNWPLSPPVLLLPLLHNQNGLSPAQTCSYEGRIDTLSGSLLPAEESLNSSTGLLSRGVQPQPTPLPTSK